MTATDTADSATNSPRIGALAFPDRRVVTVLEISARLRCSPRHVCHLITGGALRSLDIAHTRGASGYWRVPVDSWAAFVIARTQGPSVAETLAPCSRPVLVQVHREICRLLGLEART